MISFFFEQSFEKCADMWDLEHDRWEISSFFLLKKHTLKRQRSMQPMDNKIQSGLTKINEYIKDETNGLFLKRSLSVRENTKSKSDIYKHLTKQA
jgi:hypothetical protein